MQEIVKDLQNVPVNIPAGEVEKYVVQCDKDCETSEELNDDQIVPVFKSNSEENVNKDSNDDLKEPSTSILKTDTKSTFYIALQYIKQNSSSTPIGI